MVDIGHELLRVLLPHGELCRLCFLSLSITSNELFATCWNPTVGAFRCYSVLNTLPLIFLKNKKKKKIKKLRLLKWYLNYLNWPNSHVRTVDVQQILMFVRLV